MSTSRQVPQSVASCKQEKKKQQGKNRNQLNYFTNSCWSYSCPKLAISLSPSPSPSRAFAIPWDSLQLPQTKEFLSSSSLSADWERHNFTASVQDKTKKRKEKERLDLMPANTENFWQFLLLSALNQSRRCHLMSAAFDGSLMMLGPRCPLAYIPHLPIYPSTHLPRPPSPQLIFP